MNFIRRQNQIKVFSKEQDTYTYLHFHFLKVTEPMLWERTLSICLLFCQSWVSGSVTQAGEKDRKELITPSCQGPGSEHILHEELHSRDPEYISVFGTTKFQKNSGPIIIFLVPLIYFFIWKNHSEHILHHGLRSKNYILDRPIIFLYLKLGQQSSERIQVQKLYFSPPNIFLYLK